MNIRTRILLLKAFSWGLWIVYYFLMCYSVTELFLNASDWATWVIVTGITSAIVFVVGSFVSGAITHLEKSDKK